MEREPSAGSSNIASVGYDDAAGQMEVEFRNGGVYRYTCPREVFEEWRSGGFRGKHFHVNIRGLYEGVRQPVEGGPIDG